MKEGKRKRKLVLSHTVKRRSQQLRESFSVFCYSQASLPWVAVVPMTSSDMLVLVLCLLNVLGEQLLQPVADLLLFFAEPNFRVSAIAWERCKGRAAFRNCRERTCWLHSAAAGAVQAEAASLPGSDTSSTGWRSVHP